VQSSPCVSLFHSNPLHDLLILPSLDCAIFNNVDPIWSMILDMG
jgi:hypothetical protein